MVGLSVSHRLDAIRERMDKACIRAGRKPESVNLLAVSKFQSLHKIREAYDHGQRHFAENYVQEALMKIEQLESLSIQWHFIGRIQSNKVKFLPGKFDFIHSVDRASTADALNRQVIKMGLKQRPSIFLQYNVAQETSKGGGDEIEIENLVKFIGQLPQVRMVGLMVMPPLATEAAAARPHFAAAREFLQSLRASLPSEVLAQHPLDQLSMGTSHDFEVAIEEGATWVRVGSEIFGSREERGDLQ